MTTSPAVPLSVPRALLLALYVVAAAFALPSLLEFLLVTFPYRPAAAQWRFGAFGLLFNSVAFLPVVGISLAVFAAVMLGHDRTTRVLAVLLGLFALVLLVVFPLFVLDFLQVRPQVNPATRPAFDYTSLKAVLTGGMMFVAAAAVSIAGWRSVGVETSVGATRHAARLDDRGRRVACPTRLAHRAVRRAGATR